MAFVFSIGINIAAAAPGDTIYVNSTGGSDTADGYTWATAKSSIKAGTGTVNNKGHVYIANGKYSGVDNTGIILNKNMTITGQSQSGTIINGNNNIQIFHIYPNYVNVTIQKITFINGSSDAGGAIANDGYCTIQQCTFIGNTATDYGGAIANFEAFCNVKNCNFIGNKAKSDQFGGGAICNVAGIMTITGCNFINNTATYEAGAILNGVFCTASFNRFYGNSASVGTAIGNYGIMDAVNNWWGSNADPATTTNLIMVNSGSVNTSSWVILSIKTDIISIDNGKISTVRADLNHDNRGGQLIGGVIPDGPIKLNIPWGSFKSKVKNHSITADTVNGKLIATFYAKEGMVNPSFNPVKVTATADGYTTNDIESAYIKINELPEPIISPETVNINVPKTDPIVNVSAKSIEMQNTGIPLAPLALAIMSIIGGIVTVRRK
jgi:hypothetical protein